MENNRLLFRAVVEAYYYDNDGNDKTVKLLLNNVAVYTPVTVGVADEVLVNAIRNTNLNAKERNSVYSYFKANNECSDSEWFVFEAETIEQCTGLKDKNGRLIYEGDIVKITGDAMTIGLKYMDCLFKVIWSDNGFWFEMPDENDCLGFCEYWEYEVVGNIHVNPELLERKINENKRFV